MTIHEITQGPSRALSGPLDRGAIHGTIAERIAAFDQIAANLAGLALNGWDTVQKAKAACWLADARRMHPAEFMENHYVLVVKGRLTIWPRWKYVLRVMKETLPGFRYKVESEADDHATVWVTDGTDEHRVTYSLEDARRQGLLGREGNAWTSGSTREMCLARATTRACDRLGGASRSAWLETETPITEPAPEPHDELQRAITGPDHDPVPAPEAMAEPYDDPRTLLSERIEAIYGKLTKAAALGKASFLYCEMMKEETGQDPGTKFKRADHIAPDTAQRMVAWLDRRGRESPMLPSDDAQPPPREPDPPPLDDEPMPPAAHAHAALMAVVLRARKTVGRDFVKEAPPGSRAFWYTHLETLRQLGTVSNVVNGREYPPDTSILLMKDGEPQIEPRIMARLTRVLSDFVDAHERKTAG